MAEIKVGKPDIRTDGTAHIPGVRQGNHRGLCKRHPGHLPGGLSDARRSTGINPEPKNAILPVMPDLSPA
jgi:hypothetical protein